MKKILLTGVSGNVGGEVLRTFLRHDFQCKVLLRPKKKNLKLGKRLEKQGVEVIYGDLLNLETCKTFVHDASYIFHFAGIIPPTSEHRPEIAYQSNVIGTRNLIDAAETVNPAARFIYTASYAEYGWRSFKHPWGRVGDPLLPSVFDNYAVTKIKAESSVVSSNLNWVSLRLPGILYDDIIFKNMSDAIIFHTPWNTPIEWSTVRSIANIVENILNYDNESRLSSSFWKNIYNVGDGAEGRTTGFETLDRGFQLMGKGVKSFFKPNWMPLQNFHCLWLEDSGRIRSFFDSKDIFVEGFENFFNRLGKKRWYFKLGKYFSFFIKKWVLEPLLKKDNAPAYWLSHGDTVRIKAFYGSETAAAEMSENWADFFLLAENKNPETGECLDYQALKAETSALSYRLNHGYDETKTAFSLSDLQNAARFRGGKCLAKKYPESIYEPIHWQCAEGHVFELSVFAVLKGGFWCPECLDCKPDGFRERVKGIPFYNQLTD